MDERRRGLLIDFGGVLTTNLFTSFNAFCAREGLAENAVRDLFVRDEEARRMLVDFETGRLDGPDFEPAFAEKLGVAQADGLIERLMADARPDRPMIDAVRTIRRAGRPTGLVSNSWGADRYDQELLADLFDGYVLSGEVGIRKPSQRIYALGAEAIGLAPEDCVFVDDLEQNLRPAREMGMAVVHHVSAEKTLPALERILGVELT